jgi:segregation and condensation protein B
MSDGESSNVPVEKLRESYDALVGTGVCEADANDASAESASAVLASTPALDRIIEALLFVGGSPLTPERACETVHGLTPDDFIHVIDGLNRKYRTQARPYVIRPHDTGFILSLRSPFIPIRDRIYGTVREARLSSAAVDVLALVAYRQPVTKRELDGLRGSDSGATIRQLIRRGLVTIVQRGDGTSREVSYGTTKRFLELFGLASIDDLPQTQDLQLL